MSPLILQFHLYNRASLILTMLWVVEEGELSVFWESRESFLKKCYVLGKIMKADGHEGGKEGMPSGEERKKETWR